MTTPPHTSQSEWSPSASDRPAFALGLRGAVLPACFLAASWTWVIGMFLPVGLTQRFGVGGWAVFALFNVLGAASVGAVLAGRGVAQRFAARHAAAFGWFTLVTILFQAYAVAWLARRTLGGPAGGVLPFGLDTGPAVTVAMAVFVAVWLVSALVPFRASMYLAMGVLGVSVVSFVCASFGLYFGPFDTAVPSLPDTPPGAWLALAFASPAIAAGFLACPYLDATINRVRVETREPVGTAAFALGFGGPFLLMIAMTLGYARVWHEHGSLPAIIAVHVIAQAGFTAGVQTRALMRTGLVHALRGHVRKRRVLSPARAFAATFAAVFMLPLGNAIDDFGDVWSGYGWSQAGYDAFIGLYAVVFPAYVWVCAVGWTPLADRSTRTRAVVFAIASAAALPVFAVGFGGERYWLVPVSMAIVLVAPWIAAAVTSAAESDGAPRPDDRAG